MDNDENELINLPLHERNKIRFCAGLDIDAFIDIINKTPCTKRYQMLMAFFRTIQAKGSFLDKNNPASKFAFSAILKTYKQIKAKRKSAAARWNNGTSGAPPDTDEENTLF